MLSANEIKSQELEEKWLQYIGDMNGFSITILSGIAIVLFQYNLQKMVR